MFLHSTNRSLITSNSCLEDRHGKHPLHLLLELKLVDEDDLVHAQAQVPPVVHLVMVTLVVVTLVVLHTHHGKVLPLQLTCFLKVM